MTGPQVPNTYTPEPGAEHADHSRFIGGNAFLLAENFELSPSAELAPSMYMGQP